MGRKASTVEMHDMARIPRYAYARGVLRLAMGLSWSGLCCLALKAMTAIVGVESPRARRMRHGVARAWLLGVRRILGIRLVVHGTPPPPPFFLVCNHLAWLDVYAFCSVVDVHSIIEEPIRNIPVVGSLVEALEPIFVRRVKDDTARVKALMVEAIEAGKSLLMAPETPETTIRRGTGVRMFRAGLLDAAVIAKKPVHYMCATYRTPPGWPPPSQVMIFGPNPYLRTADGKIPESETAMYGPERPFLSHVIGMLSLPWQEVEITFGQNPIWNEDRIALANQLHDAVERIFVPIE
jgi:1-acyl-sn-glycerol-3-phosphate acyltransferase